MGVLFSESLVFSKSFFHSLHLISSDSVQLFSSINVIWLSSCHLLLSKSAPLFKFVLQLFFAYLMKALLAMCVVIQWSDLWTFLTNILLDNRLSLNAYQKGRFYQITSLLCECANCYILYCDGGCLLEAVKKKKIRWEMFLLHSKEHYCLIKYKKLVVFIVPPFWLPQWNEKCEVGLRISIVT